MAITTDGPNTRFKYLVLRGPDMTEVMRQMEEKVARGEKILASETTVSAHSHHARITLTLLIEKPEKAQNMAAATPQPSPEEIAAKFVANLSSPAAVEEVAKTLQQNFRMVPWGAMDRGSRTLRISQAKFITDRFLSVVAAEALAKGRH